MLLTLPAQNNTLQNIMIKIVPILATLAALPLMAQEPADTTPADNSAPTTVQCPKCGKAAQGQCPQAAVAAAIGFQQGFQMGFSSGFDQAAHMMKAGCSSCREGGNPHHGRPGKPQRPDMPMQQERAVPQQQAQPVPQPMPQQPAAA